MKRRIAALVPAVAAIALAVPLSLPTPAAAHAPCGARGTNQDHNPFVQTANGANVRSGSSTSCTVMGIAYSGDWLNYRCYTRGNDGYTWTYLENASKGTEGWVRDDLLSDGGTTYSCGF
ncbi:MULTISPECIES: SH3 domain-containing protein [Streptomyces]|uniref:SH3 domain-containing protein n=1 Tax=Streptomyces TaxID=1883 RepID=UPI0016756822|nr:MULTISPECIES: SH3 domain-containing protein [Streptomyces]MCC3774262.1 SH3 domain-containing protein [Streptomyces sp. UNOB3_S3]GGP47244.1 hypothetical protein GCM10010214_20510 [Streptomyces abikoensis]